jgi:high affinity Mn2+ porin
LCNVAAFKVFHGLKYAYIFAAMKKNALTLICIGVSALLKAQSVESDSTKKWTNHFQLTVIAQKHSAFPSKYSGRNSLADTAEPTATSMTSTLFLGRRLWKNAAIYFNPEVSGGKGLSFATGVAGALNGETYRVGAAEPQVFIARAYLQQYFPLGNTSYEYVEDDAGKIAGKVPASRITISLGKFAVSDFFDDNVYSKDPRSQFFNWSMWANGAWDYPADTRGYTKGIVVELIKPRWAIKASTVAVPRVANSPLLEYKISKAHSETAEFAHTLFFNKRPGNVRLLLSNTYSKAPSYAAGMKALITNNSYVPDVISGNAENNGYGGKKFGMGLNIDQELTNDIGVFARAGWNDGKYATWAFTEIDKTLNAGLSIKGTKWKRPKDFWAIGAVANGLSKGHKDFLKAGGTGFIIGDGALNYGKEAILETYYNANLSDFFWLTLDYQFVRNPGYNKDRGPVHVFGVRGHVQF